MSEKQNRTADLGRDPVGPLLVRLALPTICAQVVNLLYNIVDRIYIGHIPETGAAALTGMGVTFPVITLISAFAALIGMGGAPRASIAMGAGEHEKAERTLGPCTAALWGLAAACAVRRFPRHPALCHAIPEYLCAGHYFCDDGAGA